MINPSKILIVFLLLPFLSSAQQNLPRGYFTSESTAAENGNKIVVSIKKYNPSPEQIRAASKKPGLNEQMNYLHIPVMSANVSFFNKEFESKIYGFDQQGNLIWDKTIGYSKSSVPGPVSVNNGFIYAGAGFKDEDKVMIQKIDSAGNLVWQKELDSLESVDALLYFGGRLNALVSFERNEKVDHSDGTFSYHSFPVYFFLQLEPSSGNIIKKEFQPMGSYLSSLGYTGPLINSDYSYYLSRNDSAVFLTLMNPKGGTVVTNKMSKDNKLTAMAARETSNHFLTLMAKGNKVSYHIISDFYEKQKKYESDLPVDYNINGISRYYLQLTPGDSLVSFIAKPGETFVCITNPEGQSQLYKKMSYSGIVTSALLMQGKPLLIILEGRNRQGEDGTIKLQF